MVSAVDEGAGVQRRIRRPRASSSSRSRREVLDLDPVQETRCGWERHQLVIERREHQPEVARARPTDLVEVVIPTPPVPPLFFLVPLLPAPLDRSDYSTLSFVARDETRARDADCGGEWRLHERSERRLGLVPKVVLASRGVELLAEPITRHQHAPGERLAPPLGGWSDRLAPTS